MDLHEINFTFEVVLLIVIFILLIKYSNKKRALREDEIMLTDFESELEAKNTLLNKFRSLINTRANSIQELGKAISDRDFTIRQNEKSLEESKQLWHNNATEISNLKKDVSNLKLSLVKKDETIAEYQRKMKNAHAKIARDEKMYLIRQENSKNDNLAYKEASAKLFNAERLIITHEKTIKMLELKLSRKATKKGNG